MSRAPHVDDDDHQRYNYKPLLFRKAFQNTRIDAKADKKADFYMNSVEHQQVRRQDFTVKVMGGKAGKYIQTVSVAASHTC